MKFRFFILFAFFTPVLAFSQRKIALEMGAGINFTDYSGKAIESVGRLKYDFGLSLAFPMKAQCREWLLGLRFMTYGDNVTITENGPAILVGGDSVLGVRPETESIQYRNSHHYLEVPVSLRHKLTAGKASLSLNLSAGPAFFLGGRSNTNILTIHAGTNENIQPGSLLRAVNLVVGLGLGLEVPLSSEVSFQLSPHAQAQMFSYMPFMRTLPKWYAFGIQTGLRCQLH